MITVIESKRDSLRELCRQFAVKRLEIFGSAASDRFDPSRSDIDFLVEFEASTPSEHAARYFGLLAALQDLFSVNIDLVELNAVKNPYFKKSIESSRVPVYG
jgi:predicted nucleotidyltransferase